MADHAAWWQHEQQRTATLPELFVGVGWPRCTFHVDAAEHPAPRAGLHSGAYGLRRQAAAPTLLGGDQAVLPGQEIVDREVLRRTGCGDVVGTGNRWLHRGTVAERRSAPRASSTGPPNCGEPRGRRPQARSAILTAWIDLLVAEGVDRLPVLPCCQPVAATTTATRRSATAGASLPGACRRRAANRPRASMRTPRCTSVWRRTSRRYACTATARSSSAGSPGPGRPRRPPPRHLVRRAAASAARSAVRAGETRQAASVEPRSTEIVTRQPSTRCRAAGRRRRAPTRRVGGQSRHSRCGGPHAPPGCPPPARR